MEVKTYCRICGGMCGLVVKVEDNKIVGLRPDRDHPGSRGYMCIKAKQYPEMHQGPARLRHPLKRDVDGTHKKIASEKALDKVAKKLAKIIEHHGPESVALFSGTAAAFNLLQRGMALSFMAAIGSPSNFNTMTIDQSAKWVTQGRLGMWAAGRPPFDTADVCLICGANPMVSLIGLSLNIPPFDPIRRLKKARARGMKLIVIDPIETQTARQADLFLQPMPGEDIALFAAMIRYILAMNWHDQNFCDQYVNGLDKLTRAVEPFTLEYAEKRAGVPAKKIRLAVELFARDSKQGMAAGGTGPDMSVHSNLAEHMIEALNVICGRFPREGDRCAPAGVLSPPRELYAEVIPPTRNWESGHQGRFGYGTLYGTMMTSTLADEILQPGKGQIRALFCAGANPAGSLPDQRKAVAALRSLELLVTAEPRMSQTARLAHYVFAPIMALEQPDHTGFMEAYGPLGSSFAQYTPAVVQPDSEMDVIENWYLYWGLAKRLGLQLTLGKVGLDMENRPTSDELLAIMAAGSQVPYEEVRQTEGGKIYDRPHLIVKPGRAETGAKFDLAPNDVLEEITDYLHTESAPGEYSHKLINSRVRETINTYDPLLPEIQRRMPYNPARMNPADMARMNLADGDEIQIKAPTGTIQAIVQADKRIRSGVVAMTPCWGSLPDEPGDYKKGGVSTSLLVASDRQRETINGMPLMTAIPVKITRK